MYRNLQLQIDESDTHSSCMSCKLPCVCTCLSLQLPEVKLELAHGSKQGSSHSLEASLTAEGARVFKVDGRLKSGTQVKVSGVQRSAVVNSQVVGVQAHPLLLQRSAARPLSLWRMHLLHLHVGTLHLQVLTCTMQAHITSVAD
jgi:hypothetical protein